LQTLGLLGHKVSSIFGGKSRRNYGNPSVLQEDEQKTIEHMFPGLLQAELQTASMKPVSKL
jgi:hypothetical protein